MPRFAAISLLLLFTLPLWVKVAILVHFVQNRAYIVANYCENKDKPQLRCEGKCYLHKQLEKAEPVGQSAHAAPLADWLKKWELADFDLTTDLFEASAGFSTTVAPSFRYWAIALRGFPNIVECPPDDSEQSTKGTNSPFFFKNVHLLI